MSIMYQKMSKGRLLGIMKVVPKNVKTVYFLLLPCNHINSFEKPNEQIEMFLCFCTFRSKNAPSFKYSSSHFYRYLNNACHQVKYQKDLMKRFRKNFKSVVWPQKSLI